MPNMGPFEWILIVAAVVLLFGAKKIPELAKGIGQGIREFKKAAKETEDDTDTKKIDEKKG
ncbi:MAG: Twin-arginine translocation protein TatA [Bacteroidetes bacterium]|nr:Twin-arginine translocation protein TatA [Bacteroidota bacterium]